MAIQPSAKPTGAPAAAAANTGSAMRASSSAIRVFLTRPITNRVSPREMRSSSPGRVGDSRY